MASFDKRDLAIGKTLSILSAGSKFYPWIYNWMMDTPAPGNVNVIWRVTAEPVDRENDPWVLFRGNPESGRLPKDYRSAGILSVRKTAIDTLVDKERGNPAVAYALGSVAMVAELPDGFGDDPRNTDRYAAAMGIGRGLLEATVGVYVPDTHHFHISEARSIIPRLVRDIANVPEQVPVP